MPLRLVCPDGEPWSCGGRWAAGNRRPFAIRGIDVSGGRDREFGAVGRLCREDGEPFYGTMVGPWWYHTAAIVPWVGNLPFSLLRMLIQASHNRIPKAVHPPHCRYGRREGRMMKGRASHPKTTSASIVRIPISAFDPFQAADWRKAKEARAIWTLPPHPHLSLTAPTRLLPSAPQTCDASG